MNGAILTAICWKSLPDGVPIVVTIHNLKLSHTETVAHRRHISHLNRKLSFVTAFIWEYAHNQISRRSVLIGPNVIMPEAGRRRKTRITENKNRLSQEFIKKKTTKEERWGNNIIGLYIVGRITFENLMNVRTKGRWEEYRLIQKRLYDHLQARSVQRLREWRAGLDERGKARSIATQAVHIPWFHRMVDQKRK